MGAITRWSLVLTTSIGLFQLTAAARSFRVSMLPNGGAFSCANCHVNPAGGGTRNPFGKAVEAITGSSSRAFWSPALAAQDSDGDGFSNGTELGDPEGDATVIPGWKVTNPGNAASKPAENQPPQFTSTPLTAAFQGEPYQYAATASDPENTALTFSKVAGPDWLSVSPTGTVSGTPPDLTFGEFTVTLRVTDSGSPAKSTDQTFTLTVVARFTGWQALHFSLPAEADLAGPLADPDADGLPNFIEYALRRNPRAHDATPSARPDFGPDGEISFTVQARRDDPKLQVRLEAAGEVDFAAPVPGNLVETTPGDGGMQTLRFTDPVKVPAVGSQRFWRLRFELLP
jgi:hypothetical protein